MNSHLARLAAFLVVPLSVCRADEVFPVIHNQPIAIRVFDGNEGLPQSGVRVILVAGYDRADLRNELWHEEARTDGNGMLHLSSGLRNFPFLQLRILKRHACQPAFARAVFSVERIRGEGLSGVNGCGDAVAREVPGMLTVFVKAKKAGKAKPANSSETEPTWQKH
jgi:hypothetical protein